MDYEAFKAIWLPGDTYMLEPPVEAGYRVKYDLAARIQPHAYVEIGVRAGYSMWCFLQADPGASYYGIDRDMSQWGGNPDAIAHAREVLASLPVPHPWLPRDIVVADSIMAVELIGLKGAFWHIDGDHSLVGCMSDLLLAHRSGAGWILVDDTDYIDEVESAVKLFALRFCTGYYAEAGVRDVQYTMEVFHDGYRGHVLLTRI